MMSMVLISELFLIYLFIIWLVQVIKRHVVQLPKT